MLLTSLKTRSQQCELCSSTESLKALLVGPHKNQDIKNAVLVCEQCHSELSMGTIKTPENWRCLSEAIWSEHAPVKVMAYRILHALKQESWANDMLEQIYLEPSDFEWAHAGHFQAEGQSASKAATLDSSGQVLSEGDNVTLIKDLDVKGAGFTAKRGTLVKNIRLTENPEHIEGRVNGIQIVLITKFLKKA